PRAGDGGARTAYREPGAARARAGPRGGRSPGSPPATRAVGARAGDHELARGARERLARSARLRAGRQRALPGPQRFGRALHTGGARLAADRSRSARSGGASVDRRDGVAALGRAGLSGPPADAPVTTR